MISRVLKPSTIIPQELYIERSADRQLRTVVNDMGRPAYILVARQMGKTNLLINMKRERKTDIVLYLDLSNRFDNVRSWFRNVIDSMIEAYPIEFGLLQSKIDQQRNDSGFEPNTEYERHLRLLLKSIDKRVIIVLDEIDSLVGCAYSDIVLAQIRSMYFSRANYDEYSRLTYVLSGVAEPSDLIKDKNISPFNIGEKIYLEDFSRTEFDSFIKKSKLVLSVEILDQIFSWASGNPRITWDICAEIEARINAGEAISVRLVDSIVEKMYLQELDRAPVDHIRTLVESDPLIRNAIIAIRYSKSAIPDDKIKSRLYLAGITKPSDTGQPVIKNRVIDEVLSDEWIKRISSDLVNNLASAREAYNAGLYEKAVIFYQKYLSNAEESQNITPVIRLEIGLSYLWLNQTEKAIEAFLQVAIASPDRNLIQLCKLHIGTAYLAAKDYLNCIAPLQEAALGPEPITSINARLNLIVCYFKLNTPEYLLSANVAAHELVSELKQNSLADQDVALCSALYHQSNIFVAMNSQKEAIRCLDEALRNAPLGFRPFLLIEKLELKSAIADKKFVLENFISLLAGNNIPLSKLSDSVLALNKITIAKALEQLYVIEGFEKFKSFLDFIVQRYYPNTEISIDVLLDLISVQEDYHERSPGTLLQICAERFITELTPRSIKIEVYRNLALRGGPRDESEWGIRYLREIEAFASGNTLSEVDIEACTVVIMATLQNPAKGAPEAIRIWNSLESYSCKFDDIHRSLVYFLAMNYLRANGKLEDSRLYAENFLSTLSALEGSDLQSDMIIQLKSHAEDVLKWVKGIQLRNIGRNTKLSVKYGDNEPIIKKYKYVEDDIKSGKCIIIATIG